LAVAELIEEGVRSCRISASTEKKRFEGKMKEVDHDEGGYKGKKNQFQNSIPNCQHQSQLSISHQKI
jgi:hypothetical protein